MQFSFTDFLANMFNLVFATGWVDMMTITVVTVDIYQLITLVAMSEFLGQRTTNDSSTQVGARRRFSVL